MAGMGPPPKHPSQRRRTTPSIALTDLPAEGRAGEAPPWPLVDDITLTVRRDAALAKLEQLQADRAAAEAEGKPLGLIDRRIDKALELQLITERQLAAQRDLEAVVWADLWQLPQAVQWERLGWTRDVAQYARHKVLGELGELAHAVEARQWSDRLGLNSLALLRLRWQVVADELAAARATPRPPTRLLAVDVADA